MRFSVEWIDGGSNGAAEERATLCDLRIYVSDQNACRFFDFVSNEDTEALIVPAVHLAEGLATDWWIVFGGRDREHRIQRYRTGFALPDLSFRADGSTFEITGKSFYSENPHLSFPFAGDETLPRGAAEATLSGFIEAVVDRLAGEGLRNSEVSVCWSRVVESRSDPDELAFCEASGALGLDPYAIPEVDARFIEQAHKLFSDAPLIEFLAGFRGRARLCAVADYVGQVEARPAEQSSLPELEHVADQIEDAIRYHRDDRPWAVGYRAARAFRRALGVGTDRRSTSQAFLARQLGGARFEPARLFSGVRALVARTDGGTRIHLHDHQQGSRSADAGARTNNFAFARAVGDAVCFRDARRSVINDLHHAERQATGRAFAAEFLAPVDGVVDMYEDRYDEEEIADEFDVSSYVIENQIRNQNRIRGACRALE